MNIDRDVDIDVDDGHHGCCYHDNPVAKAMAVTAAVAVVGSMVSTLPSNCQNVVVNGLSYRQCGNTWYQPQIGSSSTTYVVVNSPY